MIVLQLILFCAVFTLIVKLGVGNNALNGLYFYPKAVQERVYELGLTDRQTVKRKRIIFMTTFFIVMLVVLLLMIGLWVGHSKFWIIPGTEEIPFVQTWKQVLKKRGILTLIWIIGAAVVAALDVLIFGIIVKG